MVTNNRAKARAREVIMFPSYGISALGRADIPMTTIDPI